MSTSTPIPEIPSGKEVPLAMSDSPVRSELGRLSEAIPVSPVEGKLGELAEKTTKAAQKMMGAIEKIYTNLTPAQATCLIGGTCLIIEVLASDKKEDKEREGDKKPKESARVRASDTREDLRRLAEVCPVLPVMPIKVLEEMPQNLKGKPQGIVKAVEILVKKGVTGDHCWDWTDKIFHLAGCKRKIVFNSVPEYASKKYEMKNGKKEYVKTPDCGTHHGNEKEFALLEPGDHIFINNKNQYDNHGNHSEIFLGWVDRSKLIAKTAGYPGKGKPPYISSSRNFNKTPITYIARPIPMDKPPMDKQAPLVS
jgi:hypothetical protein